MDPAFPSRRRTRRRHFNYATPGGYGVTLCVQGRRAVFGAVEAGRMIVNAAGAMVQQVWLGLPRTFPCVLLDAMVVMPNHMHGVLHLRPEAGGMLAPVRLDEVIAWFKTRTSHLYTKGVRTQGWPLLDGRLWQRSFYERWLRDERELLHARGYIVRNPQRWGRDPENPQCEAPA